MSQQFADMVDLLFGGAQDPLSIFLGIVLALALALGLFFICIRM